MTPPKAGPTVLRPGRVAEQRLRSGERARRVLSPGVDAYARRASATNELAI
ncbi:MAG: hypothetical protein ACYCPT_04960 [Acidimicrobiales bacterium]